MAINIRRFDKATAGTGHNGTILASDVLPEGMKAPFGHAYGYLEKGHSMEGHAHPTEELYIVYSGTGVYVQGGENRAVRAGDVIQVPHDQWHTMMCTDQDEGPFLWAAFWWDPVG